MRKKSDSNSVGNSPRTENVRLSFLDVAAPTYALEHFAQELALPAAVSSWRDSITSLGVVDSQSHSQKFSANKLLNGPSRPHVCSKTPWFETQPVTTSEGRPGRRMSPSRVGAAA